MSTLPDNLASRPGPSSSRSQVPRQPRLEPFHDWGTFSSVSASSVDSQMNPGDDHLTEDDLLGSFDEETVASTSTWSSLTPSSHSPAQAQLAASRSQHNVPFPRADTKTSPIHITLPPRPDEISPDYEPASPRRPSRRLSHGSSFRGPSSPPVVSVEGNDIIFHPESSEYMAAEMDGPRRSHRQSSSHGLSNSSDTNVYSEGISSPTQTRLLNTLAMTTKLASKWKVALDPPPPTHTRHSTSDAPTPTAEPIDINHSTPFATAEQIAGSHIAPSGAPGFSDHLEPGQNAGGNQLKPGTVKTSLVGRRPGTREVLSASMADILRQHLPPRQRLSNQWTLLFSLDQHGASLSSLYRYVEKYTPSHPTSGNLLVARDSDDNLFGIYLNEAILKREGGFFGSGESFLFKYLNDDPLNLRVFPWTGKNLYIALCETTMISFGGGGTSYGLSFDSTFSRNSSATSPAFDNEVLCSNGGERSVKARRFECLGLEVWGT